MSVCLHAALLVAVWPLSANVPSKTAVRTDASRRWQQLAGQSKTAGKLNRLFDILTAPDAVRFALKPVDSNLPTRALGWWSPTHGLWFALDAATASARGRTFPLTLTIPQQRPVTPGVIYVHEDGTGQMLSLGDLSGVLADTGVITLSVEIDHVILAGTVSAEAAKRRRVAIINSSVFRRP